MYLNDSSGGKLLLITIDATQSWSLVRMQVQTALMEYGEMVEGKLLDLNGHGIDRITDIWISKLIDDFQLDMISRENLFSDYNPDERLHRDVYRDLMAIPSDLQDRITRDLFRQLRLVRLRNGPYPYTVNRGKLVIWSK